MPEAKTMSCMFYGQKMQAFETNNLFQLKYHKYCLQNKMPIMKFFAAPIFYYNQQFLL